MLRMDESNKIYKDYHINGFSKNQIANKFNRSWATIDKIIALSPDQIASRSSRRNRSSTVITDEVKSAIKALLDEEEDLNIPRKQKYKPGFIFDYLIDRKIYSGSHRTLRRYIARQREKRKQSKKKSFVQLEFEFGDYLQVDHGPVTLILDGQKMAAYLFVASVPGATLKYCQFYPTKAQEAWGDFHERAFSFFGGIFPHIIYDNDSVLKTPKTKQPTRFTLELQHYYGFKAIFCNKASGWEKGSVENAVGYCRRNFLAGLPQFDTLDDVNKYLLDKCCKKIKNGHHYENKRPLVEIKNDLQSKLWPLKNEKSWSIIKDARVSSQQMVRFQGHRYSIPELYVGSLVQMIITPFEIKLAIRNEIVANHQRVYKAGQDSILLDHYLDQLARKPRALDFAKVVRETQFDKRLMAIKERLKYKLALNLANKNFVKILQLKRECTQQEYEVVLDLAIESGAITYEGIRSILRELQCEVNNKVQEIESDHIKIDHHFNLKKYSELERRQFHD